MSDEHLRKKKGYMALRNNVYDTKLELWHVLKPLEYYLVDIIIDKTIKWRQKEAKITIEELTERTRQHRSEIYRTLKSLEIKKVIFRRKQRHDLIIGLNEDYFGELLIKRHEDALHARRNKIKIVVDNSKKECEIHNDFVENSHNISVDSTQDLCGIHPQKDIHLSENIGESSSLNTFFKDIFKNTSLKDSKKPGESFTLSGEREQEEHRLKVLRQLEDMKAGKLA